jgi:hypothetical protein
MRTLILILGLLTASTAIAAPTAKSQTVGQYITQQAKLKTDIKGKVTTKISTLVSATNPNKISALEVTVKQKVKKGAPFRIQNFLFKADHTNKLIDAQKSVLYKPGEL